MNTGKILLGVLAGVAAGALLGVLLAPDKGSVTRDNILSKGEGYAENLKEKLNNLVDGIKKDVDGVNSKAQVIIDNGISNM